MSARNKRFRPDRAFMYAAILRHGMLEFIMNCRPFHSVTDPMLKTTPVMKDLARMAGCSVNTVSLALRNSHRVSVDTRERIKRLAEEHGYRPNPLVSALMSSRRQAVSSQTLAVLTKFDFPLFTHPHKATLFPNQLLEGLREKAGELGFKLEEFPTLLPGAPDGKRLTDILLMRGIRGVILFPSGDISVSFPELDWQHFAVVAAGFHSRHLPVHRTTINHAQGIELALSKLEERGHHRIAFAEEDHLDPRWQYLATGRFFAWQALQKPENRIPLIPGRPKTSQTLDLESWVLYHRPEAIIVIYDSTVDHLKEIGRRVDYHPTVAGVHLTKRRDFCRVDPRVLHLGRTSVSVLAREIYLNHYGLPPIPETISIGGAWQEADPAVVSA